MKVFFELQTVFECSDQPEVVLSAIAKYVGQTLHCDRCFIYLRNPDTQMGRIAFCWRRHDQIPDVFNPDWQQEPTSLPHEDPLFAAALQIKPSLFVDDVETASPDVLNRKFEQENFGHRALIHAHLQHNGQLWGVLQPCVFGYPRQWTEADRQFITEIEQKAVPFAIAYVKAAQI